MLYFSSFFRVCFFPIIFLSPVPSLLCGGCLRKQWNPISYWMGVKMAALMCVVRSKSCRDGWKCWSWRWQSTDLNNYEKFLFLGLAFLFWTYFQTSHEVFGLYRPLLSKNLRSYIKLPVQPTFCRIYIAKIHGCTILMSVNFHAVIPSSIFAEIHLQVPAAHLLSSQPFSMRKPWLKNESILVKMKNFGRYILRVRICAFHRNPQT